MLKKFNNFNINESKQMELHYYSFDWDDNILHMPTVIHMDKQEGDNWVPTDVSTSEFAQVRSAEGWRLLDNNPDKAFSDFRDYDQFLDDVKLALSDNQQGPAWEAFMECLEEGAIFSIITARGHEPGAIRQGVEHVIDNVLTDEQKTTLYNNCLKHAYLFAHDGEFDRISRGQLTKTPLIKVYLDNCDYYGVSSDWFAKNFGNASASNPEKAKEIALETFINKCNDLGHQVGAKSVSVGFSDDDKGNVEHVRTYFKEKSALFNTLAQHDVKFNLYDTTDRNIKGGVRDKFHPETIEESNGSNQAPGMASSIMPYTQFNNMADKYFPSDTAGIGRGNHELKRAVKHIGKFEENWRGEIVDKADKKKLKKKVKKSKEKLSKKRDKSKKKRK